MLSCKAITINPSSLETVDITIHGRDLHFIRTVAPHGRVYGNQEGDEALVSHNPNTDNVFGSLTTHEGRSFFLEKCKTGHVWKELSQAEADLNEDDMHESRHHNISRVKRSSSSYGSYLEKGRNDDTTMATFSIKYYYTHEMAAVTDDIQGFMEYNLAVLNQGYENSNIPLQAKIHCIEHSYLHDARK